MSDVFVSYKAEDRRRVYPLVEALEADGFTVWWDTQIGGGDSWRETIQEQLESARCVIVVWSKQSVGPEGHFVRDEANRALRRHVYLPVRIDKVDPPLGFGETQALSLIGWKGGRSDPHLQAIMDAARAIIAGEVHHVHHHAPEPAGVSRRTIVAGGAAAAASVAAAGWFALKPGSVDASQSIAVLPFANLSGDPAQAYFSDGIAEELRSALARLAGLKVVGRNSSEAVRNDDAETAAKKLGVANILTGSVRSSPSVVRIRAQLIDGKNSLERWSDNYDRAPGDAIKIQTEIAENVVRALSAALAGAAEAAITVGGTQNAGAQSFVLQAEEARNEETKAGVQRALQLIDEALRLDPNYADAYARKALYLSSLGNAYASGSAEMTRARAEALRIAKEAITRAPKLARGHYALARIYESMFEIAKASTEYERALQLAPSDAALLRRFSYFMARIGKESESLRLADRVLELDPLNPDSYENRIGALFDARRYQEAVNFAEETRRKSPDLIQARILLGDCYVMLGKFREAQQQYSLGRPDQWERLTGEAILLARSGDRSGAQQKLQRMQQLYSDAASYQYGEIYAQLGEKDRAIAALERAWAIRDGGLMNIRIDPALDPLRGDPRFEAIFQRMNFPA